MYMGLDRVTGTHRQDLGYPSLFNPLRRVVLNESAKRESTDNSKQPLCAGQATDDQEAKRENPAVVAVESMW